MAKEKLNIKLIKLKKWNSFARCVWYWMVLSRATTNHDWLNWKWQWKAWANGKSNAHLNAVPQTSVYGAALNLASIYKQFSAGENGDGLSTTSNIKHSLPLAFGMWIMLFTAFGVWGFTFVYLLRLPFNHYVYRFVECEQRTSLFVVVY